MPSKISDQKSESAAESEEPEQRTRLYIAPLNAKILAAVIPSSVLPSASNISYHTLETFPEKEYGFVDLPAMEAQKIKKKLNGAILRGTKVNIEEARPVKREIPAPEQDLPQAEKTTKVKSDSSKKRKRAEETLPGVELQDRKVKRGWTEPTSSTRRRDNKTAKDKKEAVKSKYTNAPECLFRTSIPANKAAGGKDEKRKSKKSERDAAVVVHEFAKTTKHATFLRSSKSLTNGKVGAMEFVDGKGWVDGDGNVVEAAVVGRKPSRIIAVNTQAGESEEESSSESESGDSSESESDLSMEEEIETPSKPVIKEETIVESETSSSGTSSDEEENSDDEDSNNDTDSDSTSSSGSDSDEEMDKEEEEQLETPKPPSRSSNLPELSLEIPTRKSKEPQEVSTSIHPLEALYKRRRPGLEAPMVAPALPKFSFFGNDDDGDENENAEANNADTQFAIPMTPFTEQDFARRGMRSAAPTPDTAHPGKSYTTWPTDNNYNDDDINPTPTQQKHSMAAPPLPLSSSQAEEKEEKGGEEATTASTSEFQKWFYEHRGEANRAWKQRRREAAKEVRHRENKRRGEQRSGGGGGA